MFLFEEEEDKQVMGLKPMNCPGHCLVFGSKVLSITLNPKPQTQNPTP
jgi:threonyl-tRNA synthetase